MSNVNKFGRDTHPFQAAKLSRQRRLLPQLRDRKEILRPVCFKGATLTRVYLNAIRYLAADHFSNLIPGSWSILASLHSPGWPLQRASDAAHAAVLLLIPLLDLHLHPLHLDPSCVP